MKIKIIKYFRLNDICLHAHVYMLILALSSCHIIGLEIPEFSEEMEKDIYSLGDTTFCSPCHITNKLDDVVYRIII